MLICTKCQTKTDHTRGGLCDECAPDDPKFGPSHRCKLCNKKEHCTWEPKTQARLRELQICFNCNFWLFYVNSATNENSVRTKGHHYWICPDGASDAGFIGHGGSPFRIQFNDGRYIVSRNVWHQGEIPTHFRDHLSDNATFLPITLEWMAEQKEKNK